MSDHEVESEAIRDASRLQLWFELFRDLALIELALAGGIITLMGTVFQEVPRRTGAFIGVVGLFPRGRVFPHRAGARRRLVG